VVKGVKRTGKALPAKVVGAGEEGQIGEDWKKTIYLSWAASGKEIITTSSSSPH
jgi:hypothetical protein